MKYFKIWIHLNLTLGIEIDPEKNNENGKLWLMFDLFFLNISPKADQGTLHSIYTSLVPESHKTYNYNINSMIKLD